MNEVKPVGNECGHRIDEIAQHNAEQRDHDDVLHLNPFEDCHEKHCAGYGKNKGDHHLLQGVCTLQKKHGKENAQFCGIHRCRRARRDELVSGELLHDETGKTQGHTRNQYADESWPPAEEENQDCLLISSDNILQCDVFCTNKYGKNG